MPHPGMPYPLHPDLPLDPSANPTPGGEGATPSQDPAESTSAEGKKWAGKYNSPDELEAAYNSSFAELNRLREDYRHGIEEANRRVDALIAQRQQPAESDPFENLQASGFAPDVLREAVQFEARRIARTEITNALKPMSEASRARADVIRDFPDFAQKEQLIADFVAADPSLTQSYTSRFERDPFGAMTWAYARYGQANPQKAKRQSAAENPADAGLPAGRGTGERVTPAAIVQQEELNKAREYYKVYKDPMPYVRTRLRGLIPDSHFAQG